MNGMVTTLKRHGSIRVMFNFVLLGVNNLHKAQKLTDANHYDELCILYWSVG